MICSDLRQESDHLTTFNQILEHFFSEFPQAFSLKILVDRSQVDLAFFSKIELTPFSNLFRAVRNFDLCFSKPLLGEGMLRFFHLVSVTWKVLRVYQFHWVNFSW